jgi:teichuronic acid biosynthesis glycosyltransferase TuaC
VYPEANPGYEPLPSRVVRVLVVSNMRPDAGHPERGVFVRDQVAALRALAAREPERELDVELYEWPPGGRALAGAARELRRRYGERRRRYDGLRHRSGRPRRRYDGRAGTERLDVVHAHFGLAAWPGLAAPARVRGLTVHGTDVRHPRTRVATRAVLPWMDLVAAPTEELAHELPGRAARRRAQVLPCGVDVERFRPLPRAEARAALGLDPGPPCLLFPADPARAGKRYDRTEALVRALAAAGEAVQLHTLGGVAPERVPLWVNAASVVVVPSESEGFGLAVVEALACDVPVVATPVGVHPRALAGVAGATCAPFDAERWRAAVAPHLRDPDPRVAGRAHAEPYSTARQAARLADAWRALLEQDPALPTRRQGRGG